MARADPLVVDPVPSNAASWGGGPEDAVWLGLLAEMRALGVIAADRLATWADRRLGTEPGRPQLVAARAGIVVNLLRLPFTFVARVDVGEPTRPALDDDVGPLVGALVDDLYARFTPSRMFNVTVGRARVPFVRPRQREEAQQPLGAPPFLVDRVAPDRRTGLTLDGDDGVLSWVAGGYLDLDALEPRERDDDPSRGGAVALLAGGRYTRDPVGFGAGALARLREDGSSRFDLALSAQLALSPLTATVEAIASQDHDDLELGGYAEVTATLITRLTLSLRGELDGGAPGDGVVSGAAAVGWNVTKNGRNRVLLAGWLRRARGRDAPFDGIVVYLQASL